MSVTRSASAAELDDHESKRRIGSADVRESRTMSDLSRERIDRLQLLAILPDDVLEMVNGFLSFYESPTMIALGRPFTKRIETPEYDNWLDVTPNSGYLLSVFEWARNMHSAIPADASLILWQRISCRILDDIGERQFLLHAALAPSQLNLADCDRGARNSFLANLCLGDYPGAVAIAGSADRALMVALEARMFDCVPHIIACGASPVRWHYEQVLTRPRICHSFASTVSAGNVGPICVAIVRAGHSDMLDVLLSTPAASYISPVSLLEQTYQRHCDDSLVCRVLSNISIVTSRIVPLIAMAAMQGRKEVLKVAEKLPHDPADVARLIVADQGYRNAKHHFQRIESADIALELLNHPNSHIGMFFIEMLKQLPLFLAQVPKSTLLDRLLAMPPRDQADLCFDELAAMGACSSNYTVALFRASKFPSLVVLSRLLCNPAVTDADITAAAILLCFQTEEYVYHPASGSVEMLLKTGRVDQTALLIALSKKITTECVSVEVADYYMSQ